MARFGIDIWMTTDGGVRTASRCARRSSGPSSTTRRIPAADLSRACWCRSLGTRVSPDGDPCGALARGPGVRAGAHRRLPL
ncbi:MAG: hypothetical protein MZV63_18130 [Marinilabiliales bacterium]|nr:hypothetical protein [Marinilabiliales bacterium]